jgi:hypothetical protein
MDEVRFSVFVFQSVDASNKVGQECSPGLVWSAEHVLLELYLQSLVPLTPGNIRQEWWVWVMWKDVTAVGSISPLMALLTCVHPQTSGVTDIPHVTPCLRSVDVSWQSSGVLPRG